MKAARTDANQGDIVDALRRTGAVVFVSSDVGRGFTDLVVGVEGLTVVGNFDRAKLAALVLREFPGATVHWGATLLAEVKSETGQLNEKQERFHRGWKGQKAVVRTEEEALRLAGKL